MTHPESEYLMLLEKKNADPLLMLDHEFRTDVHWIKEDGVPRIDYCEAGQ